MLKLGKDGENWSGFPQGGEEGNGQPLASKSRYKMVPRRKTTDQGRNAARRNGGQQDRLLSSQDQGEYGTLHQERTHKQAKQEGHKEDRPPAAHVRSGGDLTRHLFSISKPSVKPGCALLSTGRKPLQACIKGSCWSEFLEFSDLSQKPCPTFKAFYISGNAGGFNQPPRASECY